jgi:hypothetical protein
MGMSKTTMKLLRVLIGSLLIGVTTLADAYPTHIYGRIINVSFAKDDVMIMMDVGVPDNCVGTPYNWMLIPPADKATKSLILGLWLRGDVTQVPMTVYTSGRNNGGYCEINQIDPVE